MASKAARFGLACVAVVAAAAGGCGSPYDSKMVWGGTGRTHDLQEPDVRVLGPVEACAGAYCRDEWFLSLNAPPPAETYQAALRAQAAKQYGVAERDVVLGEVNVGYVTELVGTIRGWKATAIAGVRQPAAVTH